MGPAAEFILFFLLKVLFLSVVQFQSKIGAAAAGRVVAQKTGISFYQTVAFALAVFRS